MKLDDFPFPADILSYRGDATFPDMAIRINSPSGELTGGELIELKDAKSLSIASFNSTIPSGSKSIQSLVEGESSIIRIQMEQNGDDPFSLPIRDVFYLIRGRAEVRGKSAYRAKVCLVHGDFFETVPSETLMQEAFRQVIDDANVSLEPEALAALLEGLNRRELFAQTRHVDRASVSLRFRVMTEADTDAQLLRDGVYPSIRDNSLTLLIPAHGEDLEETGVSYNVRHAPTAYQTK
ncbi:MAG: hypothetical protein O3A46_04590, partial [Candidatus Poribacteria bacterium]|nr:hypothetical protein [Candidatus Poribacteria bacterium]